MMESASDTRSRTQHGGDAPNPARAVRVASIVNATMAAWLIPSPWILSSAPGLLLTTWVGVSAGVCIASLALVRAFRPSHGASLSLANALIGVLIALVIAFFGDLTTFVAWNAIVILSFVALLDSRSALISIAGTPVHHTR